MFDSIIIRPNSNKNFELDRGQLIENLFFYDQTIVHIGRGGIRGLFDLADVTVLEELLKFPGLSLYYNNSHVAIGSQNGIHFVDSIGLSELDIEKELYEESFSYKGDETKSKKFAKKISRLIKEYKLPQYFSVDLSAQIKDEIFRNAVLLETIQKYAPNLYPNKDNIRYELEFLNGLNFKIHTNIDFNENTDIGIQSPILSLINTCEDLQVMSEFSAEISLPEFNSKLIRLKTNSILEKSQKSRKEIEVFSHYIFDDSWALREAINNKEIHVKAILDTLRKASKYKAWLKELPSDSNLMREYMEKVEEKSILERLPFKAIRFYLFNGLGAILSAINPEIGIPTNIALNTFDSFLLDNLSKKWSPSQFIERDLRPLIKS